MTSCDCRWPLSDQIRRVTVFVSSFELEVLLRKCPPGNFVWRFEFPVVIMGPNVEYLVHWRREGRWDVLPEPLVPAELRHEGAFGLIPYHDGKRYLGEIIKISGKLPTLSVTCLITSIDG